MMAGCAVAGRDPVTALTPVQSSGWDTGANKMVEPESAATSAAAAAAVSGDPAAGRAVWWLPNSGSGKCPVWSCHSALCHLHAVCWGYCNLCGRPPRWMERLCVHLGCKIRLWSMRADCGSQAAKRSGCLPADGTGGGPSAGPAEAATADSIPEVSYGVYIHRSTVRL